MAMSEWRARWRALEAACARRRLAAPMRCRIGPPADERTIVAIEERLQTPLPGSLRRVVASFSASVDISWQLDEPAPEEFEEIFSGEIGWDLAALPALLDEHAGWVRECFGDPSNAYDAVWHRKFPILAVPNGDMLAIETGREHAGAVVYLSHDDGEGHGYLLAKDFEDYVDRVGRIGGVGPEDGQWLCFTSSRTSGLEPDSPPAVRWRAWLGLGSI